MKRTKEEIKQMRFKRASMGGKASAKARFGGKTKEERSLIMSKVRMMGIKRYQEKIKSI